MLKQAVKTYLSACFVLYMYVCMCVCVCVCVCVWTEPDCSAQQPGSMNVICHCHILNGMVVAKIIYGCVKIMFCFIDHSDLFY